MLTPCIRCQRRSRSNAFKVLRTAFPFETDILDCVFAGPVSTVSLNGRGEMLHAVLSALGNSDEMRVLRAQLFGT